MSQAERAAADPIRVAVVYAKPARQVWLDVEVPPGTTVEQAIERSGILRHCPEIDLSRQKVGVHAKICALDAVLEDGARVEIYRPITADPDALAARAGSD